MLMERLGDHPEWTRYLRTSFESNKPWDVMAREILRAAPRDESTRGSAFFYAKRLEHYGQNPIDYPGLTRDVGRLFLGKDFRCCQCHDHLFIDDYKQADFQGLHAFFQNTFLQDAKYPTVGEKPTTGRLDFMSVFKKVPHQTGPRLPGGKEMAVPVLKKGKSCTSSQPSRRSWTRAQLRFSPLAELAEQLPRGRQPGLCAQHRQPSLVGDAGPGPGPSARPAPFRQPRFASRGSRPAGPGVCRPQVRHQMAAARAGPDPDLSALQPAAQGARSGRADPVPDSPGETPVGGAIAGLRAGSNRGNSEAGTGGLTPPLAGDRTTWSCPRSVRGKCCWSDSRRRSPTRLAKPRTRSHPHSRRHCSFSTTSKC